jgi:CHASE2 domain-containing sensor protein
MIISDVIRRGLIELLWAALWPLIIISICFEYNTEYIICIAMLICSAAAPPSV